MSQSSLTRRAIRTVTVLSPNADEYTQTSSFPEPPVTSEITDRMKDSVEGAQSTMSGYTFVSVTTASELQEIYRLNYQTFVEEIPQHAPNDERLLVDRFDKQNHYLIAKFNGRVVGMVAVRTHRPFSLDQKLDNLESYLPPCQNLCEIRLLAISKEHRNGRVFRGLINILLKYAKDQEYDLAIISGNIHRLKLYKKLGFVPFGPVVGHQGARYQPMYLTKQAIGEKTKVLPSESTEAESLDR